MSLIYYSFDAGISSGVVATGFSAMLHNFCGSARASASFGSPLYITVPTESTNHGAKTKVTAFAGRLCGGAPRRRLYLTGTDVHYDGAEASKYDGVWASDRTSLTPWESFVRAAFGYSLLDRGNASAGVRTGRFLATYLEPVGGLEWVPRA